MTIQDDMWDDTDEGGNSGKSGKVGFRVKVETSRDDLLSPGELHHLEKIHKTSHENNVRKQKTKRKEYADLKEGRPEAVAKQKARRQGLGGGMGIGSSPYKPHPITQKAQFSGVDPQVAQLPSELEAETNQELQAELENRLTHRPQPKREFNPKPRGP